MKKTLLCFLFLFTTVFYAQVNDIVHCPGDNNFDLAKQKSLLIGNLNPDETTVSFHLSLADATNNTNAIATPSNYNAAVGVTTIYVRIDNNGTITTNSFNVKVVAALNITATNTPVFCSGEKVSLTVIASGGVGPYYYSLNGGSFSSNATFNNLSAGVYSIQVLDTGTNCPTTVNYKIIAPPLLNATAMISGQMVTITPIGGTAPYQYSLEGINYQLSANFVNLTPGNHVFMVRDINGCMTTVPATVLPSLTTTAIITKEMDCSPNSNASITIAAAGGQSPYTYSLNDGPFQANNDFSNLIPGTYSIKAKDAVNTISNPTAITINPLVVLSTSALVTNPTSCSTGTITAMATGGKAPYVYSFDGGMNFISSNVFNTPNPGTYVIIVKDSKGCLSSSFTTTVQPAQALTVTASNKPILCNGETASLTINVSAGSGSYQYTLNGASFVNDSYLSAGVYDIQVRDIATGCIATTKYTITEPTAITATYMVQNQNIAVITASGGTGSYQYSLDGINYQASNVFTNLIPGTYDIRVRDAQGCSTTVRATVAPFLHAAVAITKELDCTGNGNNGAINVAAIGGQAPYLYSVDNGYTYQGLNIFNNLIAGTYSVTVKDALNSVTNPTLITLAPPVPVNGVALVTTATSCTNASMMVHATSGQSPFYYSIDNGQTFTNSNIFNNLTPGNYTFLIKDSKGCVSPPLFNMVQQSPPQLLATASSTPLMCAKDKTTLTINATGGQTPYQYAINNGAFTAANTYNVAGGAYFITVKDAVGCIVSIEHIIAQPTPIYPDIVIDGQTVTLNGQAGTAPYQYSVDLAAYQTENVFTNLSTGNHIIHLKDSKGCESYDFIVTIQDPGALKATAVITKQLDCITNAEITITATGGQLPYQYSIDNGATFQSSPVFNNLTAGTYIASVRDALNTINIANTITVAAPLSLALTTQITSPIDCVNKAIVTLTATGGQPPYSYSLDNGTTFTSTGVFTNIAAGNYNAIVKDSKQCFSTVVTTTVAAPSLITATAVITKPLNCNTEANIKVTATGGTGSYQYSIDNKPYSIVNLFYAGAGTHIINVRDTSNCIFTTSITVAPYNTISPHVIIKNASCSGIPDGAITTVATGGLPPYTYSIGGAYQANNVFNNLAVGNYTVSVKDTQGCIRPIPVVITPAGTLIVTTNLTNATCYNSATGTITVNASGGTSPYSYSIDGVNYTANKTFTALKAGVYNLFVKDTKGCPTSTYITITEPAPLVLTTDIKTLNNDESVGALIQLDAVGGTAPYLYSVKNQTTGIEYGTNVPYKRYSGMLAGLYTISVVDANGCIVTKSNVNITLDNPIVINAVKTPTNCINNYGSLTVNPSGGVPPYYYSTDKGATYTTENTGLTNLAPGNYVIMLKDAIGNEGQTHITVKSYVPPKMTTILSYETSNGYIGGVITVNTTGGTAPYYYTVKGTSATRVLIENQISTSYSGLPSDTYTIFSKDSNGCESAKTDVIVTLPTPILINAVNSIPLTCSNSTGSITINASGGTGPYLYSPNSGKTYFTSNTFSMGAGAYILYVKDALGNIGWINYTLKPYVALGNTFTKKDITCFGAADGNIQFIPSGGTAPYTYSLDKINYSSSSSFSNLKAGTYNVTIKDAAGCLVTSPFTITQPTPLSLSNVVANSKTLNSVDGKITITASGGKAPYQYLLKYQNGSQIIGPQSSSVFAGLSVGKYTIEVTDTAGCKVNKSDILVTSDTIFGTLMTTPVTCTTLGSITINAAGGKYPHQYSFDNGITYGPSHIASNLQAGTYTIKVKDAGGDILTLSTSLTAVNPVVATTAITSPVHCNGSNDAVIQITAIGGKAPYLYSINESAYQSSNTFSNLYAGNHIINVKDSNGCSSVMTLAIAEPAVLVSSIEVVNQTVTVNSSGGSGAYKYAISPNLDQFSTNNTFVNLEVGNYTVIVQDESGCFVILNFVINPPAPLIENKEAISVDFKSGQTLADLIVDGQNIKWYSSPGTLDGKTSKTNETPLPLTTVLVDGITYYASQTINGIESKERLAVTAKLSGALSTSDFILVNFKFYPNPVQHTLTISNTAVIDEVEIMSVSGQSILSKKINSEHSEIDLSNVSSGLYLLKVKSEGKTRTVKIVKK